MTEPIYDGFTWPVKKCSRCGKVEEMPNDLCIICREGDRLAEWFENQIIESTENRPIIDSAKAIVARRNDLLAQPSLEEYQREKDVADQHDLEEEQARAEFTEYEAQAHDYRDFMYTREVNRP